MRGEAVESRDMPLSGQSISITDHPIGHMKWIYLKQQSSFDDSIPGMRVLLEARPRIRRQKHESRSTPIISTCMAERNGAALSSPYEYSEQTSIPIVNRMGKRFSSTYSDVKPVIKGTFRFTFAYTLQS